MNYDHCRHCGWELIPDDNQCPCCNVGTYCYRCHLADDEAVCSVPDYEPCVRCHAKEESC